MLCAVGAEVQAYLEAYARDAGLLPYIHFNTVVQQITPAGGDPATGQDGWIIKYKKEGQKG